MIKPTAIWAEHLKEFRSNKRLQYASLLILLIVLIDGGLSWSDRIDARQKELMALTAEIATLKHQSQDESQLKEILSRTTEANEQVKSRLWTAPSDAIGQARLKDWLLDLVARIGATNTALNIANPRRLEDGDDKTPATAPTAGKPGGLKRFRATLTLRFTPEILERCLAELEGADPFVSIETLVVNRREMRAEIGLALLIDIQPPAEGSAP